MSKPIKNIVISGVQPSGRPHIGNYAGALKNWLDLQKKKQRCFFFIADYHSLSGEFDPKEKRRETLETALDLLALGLDPKKVTLFVQSDVPEHTELCWIFNTVTPVSFLERMTQFKDKAEHQHQNVNMGLFDYPVLQAADILLYGDRVPVGRDQVQHVELTRDIARFFNNRFGETFPEPSPILTEVPKLRSLTEPLKKMSKSFGERSYVALTDEPEVIAEKLKKAVTESTGIIALGENELEHRLALHEAAHRDEENLEGIAGVWNLIVMLRIFGRPGEADRVFAAQPLKYADLKRLVAERIAEHFAIFRGNRKKLARNPAKVWAILKTGGKKARAVATKKMAEVRKKTGLR